MGSLDIEFKRKNQKEKELAVWSKALSVSSRMRGSVLPWDIGTFISAEPSWELVSDHSGHFASPYLFSSDLGDLMNRNRCSKSHIIYL